MGVESKCEEEEVFNTQRPVSSSFCTPGIRVIPAVIKKLSVVTAIILVCFSASCGSLLPTVHEVPAGGKGGQVIKMRTTMYLRLEKCNAIQQ